MELLPTSPMSVTTVWIGGHRRARGAPAAVPAPAHPAWRRRAIAPGQAQRSPECPNRGRQHSSRCPYGARRRKPRLTVRYGIVSAEHILELVTLASAAGDPSSARAL